MALNEKTISFLFDVMNHFDNQFSKITDNCFNEVNRALNEILIKDIENKSAYILPYGVYLAKNNYQLVEPMEFFVVLPSDRESVTKIEETQKKKLLKNKKRQTIRDIYQSIAMATTYDENGNTNNLTAYDTAKKIMTQLQKYLNVDDKVYYKRNVVFLKLHIDNWTFFLYNKKE